MREATIALIGGHSAIGRALAECAEERSIEAKLVGYSPLEALTEGLELYDPKILGAADLVVLCLEGAVGEEVVRLSRGSKRPLLDLAGALPAASRPWIWPVIDPDAGAEFLDGRSAGIAVGMAGPLVAVLRPLVTLGLRSARIVTLESAATLGQAGLDELDQQIRASFSLQDPVTSVFGERLAFSCLPNARPGQDPIEADAELKFAIRAGLRGSDPKLRVIRLLVPSFTADAAVVEVELDPSADREAVVRALSTARGLRVVPQPSFGSYQAVERSDVLVGRISFSEGACSLWLAADRLRQGSAHAAVLAIEQWLNARARAP